jgi:coatomer subunit delta
VYLPIEKLYLILITNKNSNIIEDLEVIRQLHQVVI